VGGVAVTSAVVTAIIIIAYAGVQTSTTISF
jgi:hypothetical protein